METPSPDRNATDSVCLLDVPVNKTGSAFTKPVAAIVGHAIEAWERLRPQQPLRLDPKTNELVSYLFSLRGRRIGSVHINTVTIPLLCGKAGIPLEDARGRITSHRARATIATQLASADERMEPLEIMQWLGHATLKSTQHYMKITPTRLTKAYKDAGYFDRNLRAISVLIDQDAVRNGAAADGKPWKWFDLGHGYCGYDFFEQCVHRMACAKCAFYTPKASSEAQFIEAKENLQRMLQLIPLKDEERAAFEDGLVAFTTLQERLLDLPTPAGPTPRQIEHASTVIPLDQIH